MRDNRKTNKYYEELILEIHEVHKDEISGKEKDCYFQSLTSIELLACSRIAYAKGDSDVEIKLRYDFFIKHLFQSEECHQHITDKDSHPLTLTNDRFVSCATVYGICLGYEKTNLKKMAKCIPAGTDQLIDRLLAYYQPDRSISDVLMEKGKYKQLIAIMDSDDKIFQAKMLKTYLDQWPKKLGIRAPDGARPLHETPTYDGYWCYEAAAVVIVADIDDESFKDHEFYPSELMSWRNT